MYDHLFSIEAQLQSLITDVEAAPVFVPKTDLTTLKDILRRVSSKADKAVAAGAVRPLNVPVSAIVF